MAGVLRLKSEHSIVFPANCIDYVDSGSRGLNALPHFVHGLSGPCGTVPDYAVDRRLSWARMAILAVVEMPYALPGVVIAIVVLATIVVAACVVVAVVRPHGTLGSARIVLVRESGALYVLIGDWGGPGRSVGATTGQARWGGSWGVSQEMKSAGLRFVFDTEPDVHMMQRSVR